MLHRMFGSSLEQFNVQGSRGTGHQVLSKTLCLVFECVGHWGGYVIVFVFNIYFHVIFATSQF